MKMPKLFLFNWTLITGLVRKTRNEQKNAILYEFVSVKIHMSWYTRNILGKHREHTGKLQEAYNKHTGKIEGAHMDK